MVRILKLAIFLLGFVCNVSYSEATMIQTLDNSYSQMIEDHMDSLRAIKEKINDERLGIYGLDSALSKVNEIQDVASKCLRISEDSIQQIKPLMKTLPTLSKDSQLIKQYQRDKTLFKNQRVSCQQLSYEAGKAYYFIQLRLHQLGHVHAEKDIWTLLSNPNIFDNKFNLNNFDDIFDLNAFTHDEQNNFLYIALFICVLSFFIIRVLHRYELNASSPQWKFFFRKSKNYFPLGILLLAEISYMSYLTFDFRYQTHIVLIMEFILMLITSKYIIDVYLYVFLNQPMQWMDNIAQSYSILNLVMIINLLLDFLIIDVFVKSYFTMFLMIQLNILISPVFYYATCRIVKACSDGRFISEERQWLAKSIRYSLYGLLGFIYTGRIIGAAYGYERIVMTMVIEIVSVIALILLVQMVFYLFKLFSRYIQHDNDKISKIIWSALGGVQEENDIFEINMLRITLQAFVIVFVLLLVIPIIGLPSIYEYQYKKLIFEGFYIGYIRVMPINILLALLMFFCVVLLGKYFANSITRLPRFKHDVNIRTSVSLITQYTFFAIAVVIMLMVIGVSSNQLSFIIGATSFGIGVGLQNIVKDVICGIIIMFNRTIRINDHVSIFYGKEPSISGVVNKIYLLSTMIISDDDTIIYVPNSSISKEIVRNESAYSVVPNSLLKIELDSMVDFEQAHKIVHEVCHGTPDLLEKFEEEPQLSFLKSCTAEVESKIILILSYSLKDAKEKRVFLKQLKQTISDVFVKKGIGFRYI